MPTPARSSVAPPHSFPGRAGAGRLRPIDKRKLVATILALIVFSSFYFAKEEEAALPSYYVAAPVSGGLVEDEQGRTRSSGRHRAQAAGGGGSLRAPPASSSNNALAADSGVSPEVLAVPKVPYQPQKSTYIDSDFKKILNARDTRDSLAKDRKSGEGSPRDTVGSNDDNTAAFPRVVSYLSAKIRLKHLRIPYRPPPRKPKRYAPWTKGQKRRQRYLQDEEYYNDDDHMAENPYANVPECIPMHDWQTASFPSCNGLHALELHDVKFVANGFFRDVWVINSTVSDGEGEGEDGISGTEQLAVKTLRLRDSSKLDFDARNYHRHRVDAISYERLTSSPYVMNIYGYCGQSAIFEYAPDGDLSDALADNKLNKKERFKTTVEVARSLSDLHNFNDKVPAIAHTDIWHSQFVKTKRGVFALSDFNRAQFLYWNSTSNEGNCPYYYQHTNGYNFRSPEEYKYEAQTEKIDVYSMGNIFFSLLMDKWPYEELYKEKNTYAVSKLISKGKRDELSEELLESTDPIDVALRTAMDMCWEQDWRKRASAKEVADYLVAEQTKMDGDVK